MHFKKSIFYKFKSVPFFLAFLIIFLSFIPRTSSPDLCDLPPEQAIKAYSRAEWAVIYKLDELGIQLTDEMSEGLSKTITKLDLEPAPHEILSKGIDNLMAAPGIGKEGVEKFFTKIGKLPEDTVGIDIVLKKASTKKGWKEARHALGQVSYAEEVVLKKYPGQKIIFEETLSDSGKIPDILVSSGHMFEMKYYEWDKWRDMPEEVFDSLIKKDVEQLVDMYYDADRSPGMKIELIFQNEPPNPEELKKVFKKYLPKEIIEDNENIIIKFGSDQGGWIR